jgi:hypothetical protein
MFDGKSPMLIKPHSFAHVSDNAPIAYVKPKVNAKGESSGMLPATALTS